MARLKHAVIGLVGDKGDGKSLSMTRLIVRDLCLGKTVWSNMKVKTGEAILNRKYYRGRKINYRETEKLDIGLLFSLDESLVDGVVGMDEIGYFDDSRRSGSNKNKVVNACVRQVRKRRLCFYYTAKDFWRVDNRLRDETDILIECKDMGFTPWGITHNLEAGLYIAQKWYDISGRATGNKTNYYDPQRRKPYMIVTVEGRAYWDCYDTGEVIPLEEAFADINLDLQKITISNRGNDDANINTEIAIARKVAELQDSYIDSLTPAEFASVLAELELPNNKTTRGKFRMRGLSFNPDNQAYELIDKGKREGVGVSA